jgi:hypothetical protein
MSVKISLIDTDYRVCARTDLEADENGKRISGLVSEINEELITGKTAYLKIEGPDIKPITLEVSKFE